MSVDFTVISTSPPIAKVNVTGKLEREHFENYAGAIDALVEEHGKIRLLVQLIDFEGWSAGAMWDQIKFDARHFNDVDRVALVGDKQWEKGMAAFCKPFTTADVRFFESDELEDARKWLRAAQPKKMPAGAGQSRPEQQ